MRLTFAVRIGLVIVVSMTIVWIGTVVLFYASVSDNVRNNRPLPGQVAALVGVLESASPAERALVLRAVTSQAITARLEPGLHIGVTPKYQRVPRFTARAIDAYLAAAGGRRNSVTVSKGRAGRWGFGGFSFAMPIDLELRVGLNTGETLIVDAMSFPVANVFGLPVGFVAGLTGALVGLIALMALQRETKPLTRLAWAVDQIDLVGAPAVLPELKSSAPEIQALLVAFNRLQVRLSHLLRGRMAMLGGISHDVRTFLTRLRLRVDRIPDEGERERSIADIADMLRLLDDAMLASRAGAGELAEELVDFAQVVRAEVEDGRAEGRASDVHALIDASASAIVLGDRLALRRVVANLVDNALTYGKVAHLALVVDQKTVTLTVDDEGPGIPEDQREAILEPFVRLEDSRNRRTGGAGLGLAVARNLVEAHRGVISVSGAPAGGARVSVKLTLFRWRESTTTPTATYAAGVLLS